jgi:hypothetical protein
MIFEVKYTVREVLSKLGEKQKKETKGKCAKVIVMVAMCGWIMEFISNFLHF